jgi:hypothetical protein
MITPEMICKAIDKYRPEFIQNQVDAAKSIKLHANGIRYIWKDDPVKIPKIESYVKV